MAMPLNRLWCFLPLFILLSFWTLSNQAPTTQHTEIWVTSQVNLNEYKYRYQNNDLINSTAIFASVNSNPSLKSLLKAAFAHNHYEARVLPFFRGKTAEFDTGDVTVITWLTADRLGRLVRVAEKHKGPISAVLYIPPNDKLATRDLLLLNKLYKSHQSLSFKVDTHIVTSSEPIQPNTWRAVAHTFAHTDWVALWDADFEICTDIKHGLEEFRTQVKDGSWRDKLDQGQAALVIPSYEWTDPVYARTRDLCPGDKQVVTTLFNNLTLDAFETYNPLLSHATEYNKVMDAKSTDYYEITQFEFGYELYAILNVKQRNTHYLCRNSQCPPTRGTSAFTGRQHVDDDYAETHYNYCFYADGSNCVYNDDGTLNQDNNNNGANTTPCPAQAPTGGCGAEPSDERYFKRSLVRKRTSAELRLAARQYNPKKAKKARIVKPLA